MADTATSLLALAPWARGETDAEHLAEQVARLAKEVADCDAALVEAERVVGLVEVASTPRVRQAWREAHGTLTGLRLQRAQLAVEEAFLRAELEREERFALERQALAAATLHHALTVPHEE